MRHRKPVHKLTESEERVVADAFRVLAESPDTGSNYTFWASIHANCCPHKSALFLPWHRAYIYAFEDALRQAVGDSSLTLPYWNWIATPEVPAIASYLLPPAEKYTDAFRTEHGRRLPTAAEIDEVLDLPYFFLFGGPNCAELEGGGRLEDRHGLVHTWTGPFMSATKTAAFDPVFWLHHANVDRLWSVWQQTHGDQHPPCPDRLLRGIPGPWIVDDVKFSSSPRLEYDYVDEIVDLQTDIVIDGNGEVVVSIDATRQPPARLRLSGIRHTGRGPAPAELSVVLSGAIDRPVRVSLFGLDAAPDWHPIIVPTTGCSDVHHHTEHGFSVELDLPEVPATGWRSRADLMLKAMGAADSTLSIARITLISKDRG